MTFWNATPARTIRRGHLWIPGEWMPHDGQTYQHGPLFAEWEAPEHVTKRSSIVLVYGGGYQGTEGSMRRTTVPAGRSVGGRRAIPS